jgi:hypothetical protein
MFPRKTEPAYAPVPCATIWPENTPPWNVPSKWPFQLPWSVVIVNRPDPVPFISGSVTSDFPVTVMLPVISPFTGPD